MAGFDADVGFVEGTRTHPRLAVRPWLKDELVVVAGPEHALATRPATLRALREAIWALREPGSGTREAADRWLDEALARRIDLDANDYLYQMDASRDYDPGGQLQHIRARVLAILSEDDERCPVPTLREAMPKISDGQMRVIPEGPETCGHATVGSARLWSSSLRALLSGSAEDQVISGAGAH